MRFALALALLLLLPAGAEAAVCKYLPPTSAA